MTDHEQRVVRAQHPSITPDRWYVCPQPNPTAAIRLFFFPYAGGGPTAFTGWLDQIPDTLEAWFTHYPGRGSRYKESPISNFDTLLDNLAQSIRPLIDRPFAFFGSSMGALVAFELSRRLRLENLRPLQILFVAACGAPQIPDPNPLMHDLPDPEFLNALQELNGTPPEISQFPELMQLLTPMLRADVTAFETYRYKPDERPLGCSIFAFGGIADSRVSRERLEGWAAQTNSRFETIFFPGDHFFVNTAKNSVMGRVTEEINNWLAGKQASP